MTAAPGYNPLRWECAAQGCFNIKQRPKIELFAAEFRHPPEGFGSADIDLIKRPLTAWSEFAASHPAGSQPLMLRERP